MRIESPFQRSCPNCYFNSNCGVHTLSNAQTRQLRSIASSQGRLHGLHVIHVIEKRKRRSTACQNSTPEISFVASADSFASHRPVHHLLPLPRQAILSPHHFFASFHSSAITASRAPSWGEICGGSPKEKGSKICDFDGISGPQWPADSDLRTRGLRERVSVLREAKGMTPARFAMSFSPRCQCMASAARQGTPS